MLRLNVLMMLGALCFSGCSLLVDNKLADKPLHARASGEFKDAGGDAGDERDAGDDDPDPSSDASVDDAGDEPVSGDDAGMTPGLDRTAIRLSLGTGHGCGLLPSGKLTCWGSNDEGQRVVPAGKYIDVACGDYHTCAISQAGALVCVGRNRDGQRVSSAGPYTAVAAGDAHTCALATNGKASCWGNNDQGATDAPADVMTTITAGDGFTCGIRKVDSTVVCWGYSATNRTKAPAGVAFRAIDAGKEHACGINSEHKAVCWGDVNYRAPALLNVQAISAGNEASCAVLDDGSARCWDGSGDVVLPMDVVGPFANVGSGNSAVCLLPVTGSIVCLSRFNTSIVPGPTGFPE